MRVNSQYLKTRHSKVNFNQNYSHERDIGENKNVGFIICNRIYLPFLQVCVKSKLEKLQSGTISIASI